VADPGRIILLVTSPRLPAGLLSAQAWDLVRSHPVLAPAESELVDAVRAAGGAVTVVAPTAAVVLDAVAEHGTVVWLSGPSGDSELARELGLRLAREPAVAELELVYGSWDPPGARLLDVVAVLDRLVSPGGDPWLRERTEPPQQAHRVLAHYLLEEAYEAYDALDAQDLDAIREELGDVLMQVVLHARIAEDAERPWTIDDLAGELVAKLIRRNPHVFAGEEVSGVDEIMANWERIKREEKGDRARAADVPRSLPALALAAKVLARAERAGHPVPRPAAVTELAAVLSDEGELGAALLAVVATARERGLDAEAALRRAALALAASVGADSGSSAP